MKETKRLKHLCYIYKMKKKREHSYYLKAIFD